MENRDVISQVNNLTHIFMNKNREQFKAVHNVSLSILRGEILGIVGESGSGKSTLARCLMNVYMPTMGEIFYEGIKTTDRKQFKRNKKKLCTERQLVFQDSDSSLNYRMKVQDIVAEPLVINHIKPKCGSIRGEVLFQLEHVGLGEEHMKMFTNELSGGMRQRVAIARALIMEPKLLVADEPVASLDLITQAQVMNLFKHLQKEHGFTLLLIAHDLSVVKNICDRVAVMHQGEIVELDKTENIFNEPKHKYTKRLLDSILEVPIAHEE